MLESIPYSLSLGEDIFAKVLATNIKGDSIESDVGTGATIITTPSIPLSLLEDTSLRTDTSLGLTWTTSSSDGYSPILDYRINIAADGGSFSVLETTT